MNKRLKIALLLIAVLLIATLAISMAYSKYYTKVTGTGSATVAKWNFTVNGQDTNLGTITLGNTIAENSKVADGKVAPGTSGEFDVELDATGTEVALDYTIKFENLKGNIPTNLKFYEDASYQTEITDITAKGLTGSMGVNDTTKTKTVTIYWNWEYETGTGDEITTNDRIDTDEGKLAESITFDVVVTGTQQENV